MLQVDTQHPEHVSRSDRLFSKISGATFANAIIIPLAFEGHAFFALFDSYGYADAFVWVCLALTLTFLVAAWVFVMTYASDVRGILTAEN